MSATASSSKNVKSKRPHEDAFRQQRMQSYLSITIFQFSLLIVLLGIIFIPVGLYMEKYVKNDVFESIIEYGTKGACSISSNNEGTVCDIKFTFTRDVNDPIYLYYQLNTFYQNHNRYFKSISYTQLKGDDLLASDVELDCSPLVYNASILLNPCGLVANTFFNDIFTVTNYNVSMQETGIALDIDRNHLFKQVTGFKQAGPVPSCNKQDWDCARYGLPSDCKCYDDYLFWYPNDDTVQYLYESYPDIISPLEGVTNEHFMVWMRPASLPTFRKLYGIIRNTSFKRGDALDVRIVNNYLASKSLVVSTVGTWGGKNTFIGYSVYISGVLMLVVGLVYVGLNTISIFK